MIKTIELLALTTFTIVVGMWMFNLTLNAVDHQINMQLQQVEALK